MKTLTSPKVLSWSLFSAGTALTWFVYIFMTGLGQYYEVLSVLGVFTLGVGIWILKEHGWARSAIITVLFGLLLGQWWFLEYGLASVLWAIRGFAP